MLSGISGASRAKVEGSTLSVCRLRALTPMMEAPASTARLHLVGGVHLDQWGQPDGSSSLDQRDQLGVGQSRDDQQHEVGTGGTGLEQLVRGDDEVLAQHRDTETAQRTRTRSSRVPAESALLGEHRDRGGTAGLVLHGQRRRVGDLGQRALARAGALDLGDHRDARAAETRHRVDGGIDVLTAFLQPFQRNPCLTDREVLPDSGDDVV